MRTTNLLLFIFVFCCISCKNKPFEENNFADESWIKSLLLEKQDVQNFVDTTEISIRVSSKKIMTGFINAQMRDEIGAFNKLVEILDDFKNTPHNPNTKKEFLFFDGSNAGNIVSKTSNNQDLFKIDNYKARENNLHDQFKAIADDIILNDNKNKFHVILSDGETTIRKFQQSNTSELSVIRNAVKDILMKQPNTCIGVISILSDFKGSYNYEIDSAKEIVCKRYLYAFCIFNKSFMPEFEKFAEDAIKLKGSAFVFNPQVPDSFISTTFNVFPEKNGSKNKSKTKSIAAYSFPKNLADSILVENKVNSFTSINFPSLVYKINYYKPVGKYDVEKEQIEFDRGNCTIVKAKNTFFTCLHLNSKMSPGIYQIETVPIFSSQIESLVPSEIINQDIRDNTYKEVKSINPDEILRTEGLKDLFAVIFKALNDVQQPAFHKTYISIIK